MSKIICQKLLLGFFVLITLGLFVINNGYNQEGQSQQAKAEFKDVARATLSNRLDELKIFVSDNSQLIRLRDADGYSLAHYAAGINSVEILQYIFEVAPEMLMSQSNDGTTPAFYAAQDGKVEALEFIAKNAPASLSIARKYGDLPSYQAAQNGNHECLALLALYAPLTLTTANSKGNTPAHAACIFDEVQSLLVLKKIIKPQDFDIKNQAGKTPLEISREKQHIRCEYILLDQPLSEEQSDVPKINDWLEVIVTPPAVRLFQRWTSLRLPEAKMPEITSLWKTGVEPNTLFWDLPPEQKLPYRLMFFTSAANPIKDLAELNPSVQAGQFAFWDGSLSSYAFYFLANANLVKPENRIGFPIWIIGSSYFGEIFKNGSIKIFMTYSIYEETIRRAGGIPVKFVVLKENS